MFELSITAQQLTKRYYKNSIKANEQMCCISSVLVRRGGLVLFLSGKKYVGERK
jgi:hypothetical protein